MTKTYGVSIPIAGYIYIEVDAENKDEAATKAFDEMGEMSQEEWYGLIQELECYEKLVQGNVCYAYHTRVEVEELD